jgi:hypothetical protein
LPDLVTIGKKRHDSKLPADASPGKLSRRDPARRIRALRFKQEVKRMRPAQSNPERSSSRTANNLKGKAWLELNASTVALFASMAAFAVLFVVLTWELTFYQDTWDFLLNRRSFTADSLLKPHNEHIVLIPVMLQQIQLAIFGMASAAPEYVLLGVLLIVAAGLLFIYVRRRVGPWLAVAAVALLLFIGPAWETLLWPFEICFVGSMLFGIAMLLALERDDRRGDIWACVFLTVSLGFNSLGIAFVAAAVIAVIQSRDRRLDRAFVVVIPVLLYGLWYVGWGHEAGNEVSLQNALEMPRYVLESIGAALEALLGLSNSRAGQAAPFEWGRPLAIAFIALVAFGHWRKPGFNPRIWPVAAAAATYWILAALNQSAAREPTSSRYLYASGAMVLLLSANLGKDVRVGKRALSALAVLVVAAVASNLVLLDDGASYLKTQTVLTKADLSAMQIARRTMDPHFVPAPDAAGTGSLVDVEAGKYLPAVDEYGSPAYTANELTNAPSPGPRYADVILAQALPITTDSRSGNFRPNSPTANCQSLSAATASDAELRISPGLTKIAMSPGPAASFSLRRFSVGEFPVTTEGAPGNSTFELYIPADSAPQAWFLHVEAQQATRVCERQHLPRSL